MLEHFSDLRNSSNTVLYLRVEAKSPEKTAGDVSDVSGDGETLGAMRPATGGPASYSTLSPDPIPGSLRSGSLFRRVIGLHADIAPWIASYGSPRRPGYEVGAIGSG
ncbi:MAG: hypothetical protein ACLR76_10935 [Alistipes sp.]